MCGRGKNQLFDPNLPMEKEAGAFKSRPMTQLMFDPVGYEVLYNFAKKENIPGNDPRRDPKKDPYAELRKVADSILKRGDSLKTLRECSCGKNVASYGLYFVEDDAIFQRFHCEECKPSDAELDRMGASFWLVPLKFSCQRMFKGYSRERFVEFMIRLVGMKRPISRTNARKFFFPGEVEAQEKAILAGVPEHLRQKASSQLELELT